jgi:hypothetical protein
MKKLLMVFVLLASIISTASAEPMGHFHRSPHHHGHHHHHHHQLTTPEEQKPVH